MKFECRRDAECNETCNIIRGTLSYHLGTTHAIAERPSDHLYVA